nr:conjugal transfer protein TraX [Lachnospiraceae bacterium]
MNGALLKKIAVLTMLVDHIGAAFFIIFTSSYDGSAAFPGADIIYQIMRIIGRTAFPVFCFFIVEGFFKTRSRKRYLGRLAVFALISEIPFDLAFYDRVWNMTSQNVFFTLFFGLLALTALHAGKQVLRARKGRWRINTAGFVFLMMLCPAAAYFCRTDYNVSGVLLILILYELREQRFLACLCGYLCMLHESWCFPAFVLLNFYDGSRGKSSKYFYYVFYPVHLLCLAMLRMICLS